MKCKVCQTGTQTDLLEFADVSRTGQYLKDRHDPVEHITLQISFCDNCGTLFQKTMAGERPLDVDYSFVNRSTERQLPGYAEDLISSVLKNAGAQDVILEIGCNVGTFLSALKARGQARTMGIEPSIHCARAAEQAGHMVMRDHLNEKSAREFVERWGNPQVLLCRHTLEHVSDPRVFVKSLRAIIDPDGMLLLEVPDSVQIWEQGRFHEFWDEHLNYFSEWNLKALLEACGFQVEKIRVYKHLDSQNLVAWARPGPRIDKSDEHWSVPVEVLQKIKTIPQSLTSMKNRVRSLVGDLEAPRVAMGAGHLQQNFLSFMEITDLIHFVVDDDPVKTGKFLSCGKGLPIRSTESLRELAGEFSLVKTAFGYESWMEAVVAKMRDRHQVVEPLVTLGATFAAIERGAQP